jgi:hypothetical protein
MNFLITACSGAASVTPLTQVTPTQAPAPVEYEPTPVDRESPSEDLSPTPAVEPEIITTDTSGVSYPVVDTGQEYCYSDTADIPCPTSSEAFYGQDAQYQANMPAYQDNGDGTVTDLVSGLMWAGSPDLNGDGRIDIDDKLTYDQAVTGAGSFNLAGYDDWLLPTIKELYSLIAFSGVDPSGWNGTDTTGLVPFIDAAFEFGYGDTEAGERVIDAQFATSTKYVSTTMGGAETMFGVNFADGRIKGYPTGPMRGQSDGKLFYVLYVLEGEDYGINDFVDNLDGTISDNATGLVWMKGDSGYGLDWGAALTYCEDLNYAGSDDWRLPNVKELQSIVDYSRSPDTTNSAAIDPLFEVTIITNEAGESDYPAYWSSTTHANVRAGANAAYVAFGRALGYMNGRWMDVHGAGAQRSDPKSGDPANYPTGHGPQGDAIRIGNYVRCVRSDASSEVITGGEVDLSLDVETPSPELAASPGGPSEGGPPGSLPVSAPPQKAIQACVNLSVDSACTFSSPKGMTKGTCLMIQNQLACVPESGPGGGL